MKFLLLVMLSTFALSSLPAMAGGTSATATIRNIKSVTIEEQKITIIGEATVEARLSLKGEGRNNVQTFEGDEVRFELIPYWSNPEIEGAPTGGHPPEEIKGLSMTSWAETTVAARKLKAGDAVVFSYQGEILTFKEGSISIVHGYANLFLNP